MLKKILLAIIFLSIFGVTACSKDENEQNTDYTITNTSKNFPWNNSTDNQIYSLSDSNYFVESFSRLYYINEYGQIVWEKILPQIDILNVIKDKKEVVIRYINRIYSTYSLEKLDADGNTIWKLGSFLDSSQFPKGVVYNKTKNVYIGETANLNHVFINNEGQEILTLSRVTSILKVREKDIIVSEYNSSYSIVDYDYSGKEKWRVGNTLFLNPTDINDNKILLIMMNDMNQFELKTVDFSGNVTTLQDIYFRRLTTAKFTTNGSFFVNSILFDSSFNKIWENKDEKFNNFHFVGDNIYFSSTSNDFSKYYLYKMKEDGTLVYRKTFNYILDLISIEGEEALILAEEKLILYDHSGEVKFSTDFPNYLEDGYTNANVTVVTYFKDGKYYITAYDAKGKIKWEKDDYKDGDNLFLAENGNVFYLSGSNSNTYVNMIKPNGTVSLHAVLLGKEFGDNEVILYLLGGKEVHIPNITNKDFFS